MRILQFNVTNNTISKDPSSDFSMLSKESEVTLKLHFDGSWDGFVKVVKFTKGSEELEPRVLIGGSTCDVPYKALKGTFFRITVLGKNGTKRKNTRPFLILLNEAEKGGNE